MMHLDEVVAADGMRLTLCVCLCASAFRSGLLRASSLCLEVVCASVSLYTHSTFVTVRLCFAKRF